MNKLNLYCLRDNLVGDSSLILSAKNDAVLKRNIKGAMLSEQQNPLNTDTADKSIYFVGTLDTDEGKITALDLPVYVFGLEEIRQELVEEIQRKQSQASIQNKEGDPDGNKES